MKTITWEEFCQLPLVRTSRDEVLNVEEAGEIVSLMKSIDSAVGVLRIGSDINFVGCSEGYVLEKISLATTALEWTKRRIKEVAKSQRS